MNNYIMSTIIDSFANVCKDYVTLICDKFLNEHVDIDFHIVSEYVNIDYHWLAIRCGLTYIENDGFIELDDNVYTYRILRGDRLDCGYYLTNIREIFQKQIYNKVIEERYILYNLVRMGDKELLNETGNVNYKKSSFKCDFINNVYFDINLISIIQSFLKKNIKTTSI